MAAMKYTMIPPDTFKSIALNAGILTKNFDPTTRTVEAEDIFAATSGGVSFTATPSYTDFGEDIDNCPKNSKELKQLDSWEVKITGTAVTVSVENAKDYLGAADVSASGTKIVPRNDIVDADFFDLWWVGDYGQGGCMAIHMLNSLSTGGISMQTTDKAKTTIGFEFTGHFSIEDQKTVPFEIYILEDAEEEGE